MAVPNFFLLTDFTNRTCVSFASINIISYVGMDVIMIIILMDLPT